MIDSLSAPTPWQSSVSPTPPSGSWSPRLLNVINCLLGMFVQFIGAFASVSLPFLTLETWLETSLISNGTSGQAALPRVMSAPAHRSIQMLNTITLSGRHLQCLTGTFSIGRTICHSKQALANNTTTYRGNTSPPGQLQTKAWPSEDKHQGHHSTRPPAKR